jgi:pyruvate formate lyase activating enzyme
MTTCKAKIDSFYHGSALDGDGLRPVVFFSGCNLRCSFCHNPETLYASGTEYSVCDVVKKIERYKNYIKGGGVTLSGGEPFLQADFCSELIEELKKRDISVIAETNGLIVDEKLISLLDGVRLDIKNQNGECGEELISRYSPFLKICQKTGTPVLLTNVLVPTINDKKENADALNTLKFAFDFCDGIKLLPFHSMCKSKYERMNIPFPSAHIPDATKEDVIAFMEKLK